MISVTDNVGLSENGKSSQAYVIYNDNGMVNVKFNLAERLNADITVHNILGQVVFYYPDLSVQKDNISLNLEGLSRGMYVVRISTGEHSFSDKITID